MFTISKQFHFSASHQLSHLPTSHPCSRLHGHNYIVEIELASMKLNEQGFVVDYNELDQFKSYLDENYDHRHLNDILGSTYSTAENLAKLFYQWCHDKWPQVSAVIVRETYKTKAEYRPIKK